MGVEFAVFSKIEARLKALYVRKKGTPEGGLKGLTNKGFWGGGSVGWDGFPFSREWHIGRREWHIGRREWPQRSKASRS